MMYVINEAPADQYISGTGDLGFRVRKGGFWRVSDLKALL